eukprot:1862494-Pyramimonas_sp.AAC.1
MTTALPLHFYNTSMAGHAPPLQHYSTRLLQQRGVRHLSIPTTILQYTRCRQQWTIILASLHCSTIVQHFSYSTTASAHFGDNTILFEYYSSGVPLLQHYSAPTTANTVGYDLYCSI